MDKGFDPWSQNQQLDWQPLDQNLSSAQFGFGPQVIFPSFGNMISPRVCHGFPRYHQGFVPMVNSSVKEVKEKVPEARRDLHPETNGVQKKFIVFDQSGDQTTLMYSLGVGPSTRYHFPSLNDLKPQFAARTDCVDEENDSKSEMREDTEELNALLYSDDDEDDDDGDDDEEDEASTAHSPSSMMGFHEQKRGIPVVEEEEVASSGGPLKRRKRENEGSFVNSLKDTASSGKSGINCSGNEVFDEEYDDFSSGNKKLRIEKMKETINVLQNLIPGDRNGKSAIMVIDEAIHYLRSLKVKAKALGLDSF